MSKETKRVFQITLMQIKKSRLILAVLCCVLLSFFLVYHTWSKKEAQKQLLFETPNFIYEQYDLVKKEEKNPDPFIQSKLKESKRKVIELETAQKYNILYTKDERVSLLGTYADLKMRQEEVVSNLEKEQIEAELKELESFFALTIQDHAHKEIEKHEKQLEEMKETLEDQGYNLAYLPQNLAYALSREELLVKYYGGFLDKDIDLYHPKYAVIERKIELVNQLTISPKTEEEFKKDAGLYTKYNSYLDYYQEWSEKKSILSAEDSYLDYSYSGVDIYPSSTEWGQTQVYTYQDGYFMIFVYGLIVTLCFTICMTSLFHKDYENDTILQYQIHVSSKSYLRGRLLAATLLLMIFLGIGYLLIPWFSTFFLYRGVGVPSHLYFFTTNHCLLGESCTSVHSLFIFALYIYFLQLFIGVVYLLILNTFSMLKPPKTVLYLVSIFLVGLGIFSSSLYTNYHLTFMKWIPTTYLNYYYLLEQRAHFFLKDLLLPYAILILTIVILMRLQKRRLDRFRG